MTAKNKGDLRQGAADTYFNNNEGLITPTSDRDQHYDEIDSALNLKETTTQTAEGQVNLNGGGTHEGTHNFTGSLQKGGADVLTASDITTKLSFLASSSDTITISTDSSNPSFVTGLSFIGDSTGFELTPTTGAVRNVSGRTLARVTGSFSFQPQKTGGGTNVLYVWSESSPDGSAWTANDGSLRSIDVNADGESFVTALASAVNWANNSYIRFKAYETGTGTITIQPVSTTSGSETINGVSFALSIKED